MEEILADVLYHFYIGLGLLTSLWSACIMVMFVYNVLNGLKNGMFWSVPSEKFLEVSYLLSFRLLEEIVVLSRGG